MRQLCSAFGNFFMKLVKMDPFRQANATSSIWTKVFRTMFLKPGTVSIISRWYRMGEGQSVEALQWLEYIGQTRRDVIHVGNGRVPLVPNVKVEVQCAKTKEIFKYLGCFWHGCPCMLNRHKPIGNTQETLLSRYEETTARLQNIENACYKVFSISGASLENF